MSDKLADFWTERGGLTVNVGDPNEDDPNLSSGSVYKRIDLAVRLKRDGKWKAARKSNNSIAIYSHRDDELDALVKALRLLPTL